MIIWNLTDRTRLDRKVGRKKRDLVIDGVKVAPGASVTVPDNFRLAKIAGWLQSEMACVGNRPDWYLNQRSMEREEHRKAVAPPPPPVEESMQALDPEEEDTVETAVKSRKKKKSTK